MSRKETSNTFSEGMVKDLNPINTPNTVLTDCLNGTLITYDGNEYSLQNEKGNYPLKNCKLKPNYIPVGVREYGDILYIVSYNPLDEHVEIGSYPSPETIHDADDVGDLSQTVNSIVGSLSGNVNYSEIVESNQPLYIFYGASEYGPDEYKLNPGDLYKILTTNLTFSKYEELKYFVFDENRRSYDITENINNDKQNKQPDNQGFYHVSWDIPGWIAVQPKFAEITDFSINIKRIVVPSYGNSDIKLNLNFQLTTDDILYTKNTVSAVGDLKVRFTITAVKNDGTITTIEPTDIPLSQIIDLKNGNLVFHSDDWGDSLQLSASEYATLTIEATPYIEANNSVNVFYDNFTKTLTFNLGQKGDVNNFDIGRGHFWYNTDSKNLEFNLIFDTKGLANSSVMEEDAFLYYSLYKLDNSPIKYSENNIIKTYEKILCKDWNIIGETTISLKMKEFNSSNWNEVPNGHNYFYPEEFYIIKFDFYDTKELSPNQQPLNETPIYKFITASELMNNQTAACYDEVAFDEWAGKYLSSIKNKKITLSKRSEPIITIEDPKINDEGRRLFTLLQNTLTSPNKYATVLDNAVFEGEDPVGKEFKIICEATSDVPIRYGSDVELLKGPIWMGLLDGSYVIFDKDSSKKLFDKFTGKLSATSYEDKSIKGVGRKEIPYFLSKSADNIGVWNYKIEPLKYNSSGGIIFATGDYVRTGNGTADMSLSISGAITDFNQTHSFTSTSPHIYTNTSEYLMNFKFGDNDVIFTQIGLGVQDKDAANPGENARFKLTGQGLTPFINSQDNLAHYTFFVLFKLSGGSVAAVQFNANNEDAAWSQFLSWCSKFNKLICDPLTRRDGAFYYINEGQDSVSGSLKISMDGTLYFADLKYNEQYNLLSDAERRALETSVSVIEKIDNISKINKVDIVSFGEVSLDKKEEIISASLDFSSKESEITDLKSIVTQINTLSESQTDEWARDTVYNTDGIDQYTNKFIAATQYSYTDIFLSLLNDQYLGNNVPLYYSLWHNTNGTELEFRKYIASTSATYNNKIQ